MLGYFGSEQLYLYSQCAAVIIQRLISNDPSSHGPIELGPGATWSNSPLSSRASPRQIACVPCGMCMILRHPNLSAMDRSGLDAVTGLHLTVHCLLRTPLIIEFLCHIRPWCAEIGRKLGCYQRVWHVHQARSYGSQVLQDSLTIRCFSSEQLYLYSQRAAVTIRMEIGGPLSVGSQLVKASEFRA